MAWALVLVGVALVVGWRFGAGVLATVLAGVWIAGVAGLWQRHADGRALLASDLWVPAVGAAALVLGYMALLRRLRRRSAPVAGEGQGLVAPRPASATTAPDGWKDGRCTLLTQPESEAAPATVAAPATTTPADPHSPLSDDELDRYARHIVLRELGGRGQRRLRHSRVLVVGAGALGSPVLLYLAAAGVGRITVADDDTVGLSNLQRQVIFATADLGRPKVHAAAEALARLNPHVGVTPQPRRIRDDDAALVGAHDLVIDGTDSFESRRAINAACVAAGVPLLSGSIAQWEGQVALYDPARGGPCLNCLFPQPPAPGLALSCAEAGVVGALPGVIGSTLALEAIKQLAGIPDSGLGAGMRGQMLILDGLWGETRRIATSARPGCEICGGKGA
ncbi:HesA/MoeB/ThiF family protein [Paracoccus alkenifer]|uniref:Molybdopterin or thiamine biosynthesis adenylyltransferase n=1 Tax=Paracoccus alkenifer TaxID=65735 RepID=A0A1H6MYV9_9RHOB|nr:HesA/MoeB/ThiF family protein [Paracoccus alkenifer]SEI03304.1 Molybdopterin or thiamine biosynthesis adenylyltransferase [Paracoccus alkenifer]